MRKSVTHKTIPGDALFFIVLVVKKNFNNPFTRLNHECNKPYGEITYYYVDSKALTGFNMLNFDKGTELIDIGYNNVKYTKYKLC